MPRPLLPPRGVFLSTRLIYHFDLPDHLFKTWVWLRGLAWRSGVTPPLSMAEISSLTGRPQASLYRHMSQLKELGALSWRSNSSGALIVSFPSDLLGAKSDQPIPPPPMPDFASPPGATILMRDSQNLESPLRIPDLDSHRRESSLNTIDHAESKIQESDHVFPDAQVNPTNMHLDSSHTDLDQEDFISSTSNKINPLNTGGINQVNVNDLKIVKTSSSLESLGGERECEGERGEATLARSTVNASQGSVSERASQGSVSKRVPTCQRENVPTPQSIYTELAGLNPTSEQVTRMDLRVKDLAIWRDSLQHWLSHRWDPKNVAMLLELYVRGGAKGCFFCAHGNHPRRKPFPAREHHIPANQEHP